jgi:hypothetical protein
LLVRRWSLVVRRWSFVGADLLLGLYYIQLWLVVGGKADSPQFPVGSPELFDECCFHLGINRRGMGRKGIDRRIEPFAGFCGTFVTLSRAVEGGILAVILPLILAKSFSQGAVRLVSARRL